MQVAEINYCITGLCPNEYARYGIIAPQDGTQGQWEHRVGEVLRFPSGHSAASAGERAASSASASAVKPALRARSVRKMGIHHSAGIVLRCDHFRAPGTPAPISAASASGDSHSPTTSLKLETMDIVIGQSVPKSKANVSHDYKRPKGHTVLMGKEIEDIAESQWREEFRQRIVAARGPRSQEVMAELLGIKRDTYAKYEASRSSQMPTRLLLKFCKICGITLEYLIEGKQPSKPIANSAPKKTKKNKVA